HPIWKYSHRSLSKSPLISAMVSQSSAYTRSHSASMSAQYGASVQVPKLKAFPWWLLRLASPFVATLREMMEMRYLWSTEVRMGNQQLVRTLGHEPHTPLEVAIEATLEGLGCLTR
ncbi:hypothetical protein P3G55_23740, partial [Leptospira sp. 96542]|nr:hypothetical protein [Leptospira sp. 96542]